MRSSSNMRHERQVIQELKAIRATLNDGKQTPPKRWHERAYSVIVDITKYVGIPGVIIAAIAPIGKLSSDLIEHYNKQFIQQTYVQYASSLLNAGLIDRANKILSTFESQKDFDTKFQYYKAKVLIAMAIQQARNYPEAYDTATILSTIQDNRGFFFPSFGGIDDIIELKMALVDIDIAQQRYEQARSALATIADSSLIKSEKLRPNIEYRLGVLGVLQFHIEEAKRLLQHAKESGQRTEQYLLVANATFQLAKATQFGGDDKQAIELYKQCEPLYEKLGDRFGLLKTYNNLAMSYFNIEDNTNARKYYNAEQRIARDVGDDLGYARATANLSSIEKREGNYDVSIRMALEALGTFKQQNNLLGVISTTTTLSNVYSALGNFAEAIAYAKQAFAGGLQLRELRAVATGCGSLANVYVHMNEQKRELVFSSLCAGVFIKYLNFEGLPGAQRDYQIFQANIEGVRQSVKPEEFTDMMGSAAKRIEEMTVQLNLGKEILNLEIAKRLKN